MYRSGRPVPLRRSGRRSPENHRLVRAALRGFPTSPRAGSGRPRPSPNRRCAPRAFRRAVRRPAARSAGPRSPSSGCWRCGHE
ncbi:hypothetical protein F7P10_18025 [Actinomadura sp. WMMB 499]|nr:hypothetical protein F7P10_18025 [Actinomadura sp. WMMB 499]